MAVLGYVNRWLLLQQHFQIQELDFPTAHRQRLGAAVNPSTAAFLAPNHPEFGLDWMMDKEISTIVAPRMASWASHEIVASAPWFWTRNNLISHRGGDAAIDYSVEWALAGNAVLLHPEGMVRWTADVVHPLFPGVAEMALETAQRGSARGDNRPVYIAPLILKYCYTRDVSEGLLAEMARIERELALTSGAGLGVADRFCALQERILDRQIKRFGRSDPETSATARDPRGFFADQEDFRRQLVGELVSKYRMVPGEAIEHTIHRLAKLIDGGGDRPRIREAERLGGFARAIYNTPTLSQEQIGESLKRIRAGLVRRGVRNTLHNLLPTPLGPRIAHVRVPPPVLVDRSSTPTIADLLDRVRRSMQATLDVLTRELEPSVAPFRHANPFYRFVPLPVTASSFI
jgi:hypothetical protein